MGFYGTDQRAARHSSAADHYSFNDRSTSRLVVTDTAVAIVVTAAAFAVIAAATAVGFVLVVVVVIAVERT